MDPSYRDKQERSIAAGLRPIFARQRRRLAKDGPRSGWAEFYAEFTELMEKKLKQTYEDAAMLAFLLLIAGSPVESRFTAKPPAFRSDPYAKKRAEWLAKKIRERVEEEARQLEKERKDDGGKLKPTDLAPSLGPQNAEDIAVTETTAAINTGEMEAGKKAERAGATIVVTWKTEKDDRVCPVCRPLDGQPESVWGEKFRNGPPAHPRCRCEVRIVTTWPDGKTTNEPMLR